VKSRRNIAQELEKTG